MSFRYSLRRLTLNEVKGKTPQMPEPETPPRFLLMSLSTVPPGGFRTVVAETGRHISAPNWRAFRDEVVRHRKANNLPVGTDIDGELQHWLCDKITDKHMWCHERGRRPIQAHSSGPIVGTGWNGSHKWRELHNYALSERPNPLQRVAWLENFANSLPCGECRVSWKRLCRQKPLPQDATPEEFFSWSVDRHNDTNSKLGKPTISLAEAKAIWA